MGRYAIRLDDGAGGGVEFVTNLPDSQFGTNAEGKLTPTQAGVLPSVPAALAKFPAHRSQNLLKSNHLVRVHFTLQPGTYNNGDFTPAPRGRVTKKSFIVANDPDVLGLLSAMRKSQFGGTNKITAVSFVTGRRKSNV